MPRPKPNKLHDELDALLDGRPVELTDELAPLVEAADALRAELAALQLDPAVADRHLERVLQGSATVVQLPPRRQASGWDLRRRVAAVALAAALVLAPATIASAAALPGQAMYPFKLAIEQLRIASVQWSPSREAGERTRVADERLGEVQDLIEPEDVHPAPQRPHRPLQGRGRRPGRGRGGGQGRRARLRGGRQAEPWSRSSAARWSVRVAVAAENGSVALPEGTREAIQAAVAQTQDVLPPPDRTPGQATPTPTTSAGPPDPGPDPTSATPPPASTPEPPTTEPPPPTTTTPPTTDPPTTDPPPTTESTATPGSAGGGDTGAAERTPAEDVPPTTPEVPAP